MDDTATLNTETRDELKSENLRFLLVLLFAFSLPFDRFYSTILLMLLIVCTFAGLNRKKWKQIPRQIWIFQMFFFLACLGYPYSADKHEAGFMIEKQLALLAFPLILPLAIKFTKEKVRYLLIALTMGSLAALFFLFANVANVIIFGHLPVSLIFSKEFFNHGFSGPLAIHAGYLSLYVSLSIIFLATELAKPFRLFRKIFLIAFIGFLSAGLFFLASRNSILTTTFVICIIYPLFYVRKKVIFLGTIFILFAAAIFLANQVGYFHDRFSSDLITDINAGGYNFEGAEPRVERWKAGLELVPHSPIFGYGTGDEAGMLKTKFVEKELFISYLEGFNAHNQYLSYLLKNGLIGLIIFLGCLVYYLKIAIKAKSFIYLSFLFCMTIGFFTENILDANKGIYYFALFNTFLGYTFLKTDTDTFQIPQHSVNEK